MWSSDLGALINDGTFQCADVTGQSTAPGARIQEFSCLNLFQLVNRVTGRCVDLNDDASGDHTRIQLWDCAGSIPAQTWRFG